MKIVKYFYSDYLNSFKIDGNIKDIQRLNNLINGEITYGINRKDHDELVLSPIEKTKKRNLLRNY